LIVLRIVLSKAWKYQRISRSRKSKILKSNNTMAKTKRAEG